eukprot:scaffold3623_cov136-Skeletonema_menzelii.AAC.5
MTTLSRKDMMIHHQQQHSVSIDVGETSTDAGLVSLHIVHNNEGAFEVEGVLAAEEVDTAVVEHPAYDVSIDKDVLDFISELELGSSSPVDVSLSPVQPTDEAELDAVKQKLDDILSGITAKERKDFDCDYSAVTECYSAVTEKVSNQTTEELRHVDASYTPTSGLTLRRYARPEISHDEVLIRVHATTISTRDCLERIRRDNNEDLVHEAWVPGHEIVGVVEQTGLNSKHLLHRRVAALLPHGGGCSRYVRVHSQELIDLTEKDFPVSTASSDIVHLLSTYMAAYQCLESLPPNEQSFCGATDLMYSDSDDFAPRNPLSGSCVLINGAGSPVGLALIDIAKNAGATVYALSHSSYEHSIRESGVKEWYPLFRKKEWKTKWSGQMDVIVDTVGDHHSYTSFYKVMASGGRFVRMNTTSCGKKFVPMGECTEDLFSVWKDFKGSSVHRMAVDYDIFDSFRDEKEVFAKDLHYLLSLFRSGKILPTVFSRVDLNKLDEEWEKVMGGGANGATGVVIVSP